MPAYTAVVLSTVLTIIKLVQMKLALGTGKYTSLYKCSVDITAHNCQTSIEGLARQNILAYVTVVLIELFSLN